LKCIKQKKPVLLALMLVMIAGNLSAGIICQQDFSNNPNYTTSEPQNLYWDSANHWYHATVHDVSSGEGHYYGDSPEFSLVQSQNFTVEFDINVVDQDWGNYPGIFFRNTNAFNIVTIGQLTKPPAYGTTSTIYVDNIQILGDSSTTDSDNAIIIPRIMESDDWHTTLGIVNPHDETLSVTITAYNAQGNVLETVTIDQLKGHGSIERRTDALFHPTSNPFGGGWNLSDIAWLQVTAAEQLHGFVEYNTTDGTKCMLTEAPMALSGTLYVPHVAEQTDFWWSEAGIVNAQDYQSVGYKAGNVYHAIPGLSLADCQENIDLTSYYGNPFAIGAGVGRFTSSGDSIAAVEMFGRKGDFHTAAALTLKTLPSKTLYFTHIASNSYWWTGCAVYNITSQRATVQVNGYDANGNLLGQNTVTIEPNTKKVALVEDFIATDPMPDYIIMKSDQNVIGFELFGGITTEILAGFSVDGTTSFTLYFNNVRVNNNEWTGISMINMGDATATVNVSAYDDNGTLQAQNTISISSRAKKVELAENLFGGTLPSGVTHITVESSEPLAGFELVGDNDHIRLGGMGANYSAYETDTQTIGTSGGTVSTGTVTVSIPENAVSSDTEITLSEIPLDTNSDSVTELIGSTAYKLEPEGYKLDSPITLTIPLDQIPSAAEYAKEGLSLTFYEWSNKFHSWTSVATSFLPGTNSITASFDKLGVYALGLIINLPDSHFYLHLTDHSNKFSGSGWLVLKEAPDFGFSGNESLKQTSSKALTEEIYNKLIQYYRNAAGGTDDAKTIFTKYVNLTDGYELDLPNAFFKSHEGKDLWCFFIPSSNSTDIAAACSSANYITYWTISMSETEYADGMNKTYEIRTLNHQDSYTIRTDSTTGQQSYFPGKTHYDSIAIDLPENNWTEGDNPILLIHGINGTASYWGNIPYQLRQKGYRVYELFHGGCGIEDIPTGGEEVEEAVNYVYGREGHQMDIITHSYGGVITRWYCLETDSTNAPNRVDDLVMIAPPFHGSIAAAKAADGDWLVIEERSRLGYVKDIHMPIYKELSPGSINLMKMGKREFPSGISPFVLAGSKPIYGVVNYEGHLFGDGAVAVSSASLLDIGVPLGIVHLNHIEQPVDSDLFNAILGILDQHTISDSIIPFYYEHLDAVDSQGRGSWYNPYQASLIVDTSSLNAASIESIEINPDWEWSQTEPKPELIKNPDTQNYYTRGSSNDYSGFVFDLDGTTPQTCSVIVHYNGGATETYENVEFNACATVIYTPGSSSTTPDMVLIPSGSFQMGSNSGDSDEQPVHSVSINQFYMGKYEITNQQYVDFLNSSSIVEDNWFYDKSEILDSHIINNGGNYSVESGYENHPVIYVSWYGAVAYCDWLTANNPGTYYLPSEAEWEYACRAGSTTAYYWGDSWDNAYGWYYYNSGHQTHPVGEKLPNAWSLYDMSGNVWEWCQDWYSSSAYSNTGSYSTNPSGNPVYEISGSRRVIRGGSWHSHYADLCRSAYRDNLSLSETSDNLGFRVARAY